jgi:hypothetical protein
MRSYRDLWLWLGAAFLVLFAAFIAIGLAYFTKEDHFSFYTSWQAWVSIVVFVLAFACFFCAIKGSPFPPWSRVRFPNIFFEIYTVSTQTATRMLSNGMRISVPLFGYGARITNLESEQNASLTIDLFLKLTPNSQGGIGEARGTVPDWPLDPNLSLNMIQMPIVLIPGTTIGGDLVYEISMITAFGQPSDPPKIRFRIQDHLSHQAKDVIMEASFGRFSRDDMIDSRGGVEIVEAQEDVESSDTTNAGGPNPPEQSSPPLTDGPQPSDP